MKDNFYCSISKWTYDSKDYFNDKWSRDLRLNNLSGECSSAEMERLHAQKLLLDDPFNDELIWQEKVL